LIEYLKDGKIKPSDRNGCHQCPILFGVECGFDKDIISQLLNLGCDINSVDDGGDTLLHYSVSLENKELENWLINEKKFDKEVKNNDGETPYA
jgi:ankyrin repeat protein